MKKKRKNAEIERKPICENTLIFSSLNVNMTKFAYFIRIFKQRTEKKVACPLKSSIPVLFYCSYMHQICSCILAVQNSSITLAHILDEGSVFSASCSVCLLHNELPVAPLALSPGTLPSADPDCSSLTRTLLHLLGKMTRNTIQPIGWLLRPETIAWAINPCCRVDKLIASAIFLLVSYKEESFVRVILQQIRTVSKHKTDSVSALDEKVGERAAEFASCTSFCMHLS